MNTPRRAKQGPPVAAEEPPVASGRFAVAAEWALRIFATLVGTVIAVATVVLACFLVPLRVGSVYTPVSWVVVAAGLALALWVTRYGAGSAIALVVPILAWVYAFIRLSSLTSAGDLVVTGSWVGYGTGLVGLGALVVTAYFLVVRPSGAMPAKSAQRPLGKR